ncbi:MAG: hypothetical protein LBG61_05865 [Burkholderiales bacterium]|nr:hypothetical protein [Burkholderiales bacterium]
MFIKLSGKSAAILIAFGLLLFVTLVALDMPRLGYLVVTLSVIPMVLYVMGVLGELEEEQAIDVDDEAQNE